jgi:hypothetical protein
MPDEKIAALITRLQEGAARWLGPTGSNYAEAAEALSVLAEQLEVATQRAQGWKDLCQLLYAYGDRSIALLRQAHDWLKTHHWDDSWVLVRDIGFHLRQGIDVPEGVHEDVLQMRRQMRAGA